MNGAGGIRTHGAVTGTLPFQGSTLSHSATAPNTESVYQSVHAYVSTRIRLLSRWFVKHLAVYGWKPNADCSGRSKANAFQAPRIVPQKAIHRAVAASYAASLACSLDRFSADCAQGRTQNVYSARAQKFSSEQGRP